MLVLELWGVGDLALASEFLRAATAAYDVHLAAKPYAEDLRPFLWPRVTVIPFHAPWTAFRRKYQLWRWPLRSLAAQIRHLQAQRFDVGLSARHDPRDHLLLWLARARQRYGFPRRGSGAFLGSGALPSLTRHHRYEAWRQLGQALGLNIPTIPDLPPTPADASRRICVHSGAAQPVRVWPLDRLARVVQHCRGLGYEVRILCDRDQLPWWQAAGEPAATAPASVGQLASLLAGAALFIGNDSGPGHLAAALGIPTFTIFGPQLPELFAPAHPRRAWIEGKPCPHKPCWDYCRFDTPHCLLNVSETEVVEAIVQHLRAIAGGQPSV